MSAAARVLSFERGRSEPTGSSTWPDKDEDLTRAPNEAASPHHALVKTGQQMHRLAFDVNRVEAQMALLLGRAAELQRRVEALESGQTVVVLREITRGQAKEEVLAYFGEHPDSYPSDVAVALQLESGLVRDLAMELVRDGRLAG